MRTIRRDGQVQLYGGRRRAPRVWPWDHTPNGWYGYGFRTHTSKSHFTFTHTRTRTYFQFFLFTHICSVPRNPKITFPHTFPIPKFFENDSVPVLIPSSTYSEPVLRTRTRH